MPHPTAPQKAHSPVTPPTPALKVAIVIPALEEEQHIVQAVSSAWISGADEVLVVDGGSRDATRQRARQEGAQVFRTAAGRGIQQRIGTQHTQADIILFQHADTWLSPDAVHQLRGAMNNPNVQMGAFRQKIMAREWQYRCLEFGNAQRVRWSRMPYGDQGIFIRRSLLEQIGGFPDLPLMEDVALSRRVARHTRAVLLPGPIHVDARRWQRHGVLRQTLKNWSLWTAFTLGAAPERLERCYRRK